MAATCFSQGLHAKRPPGKERSRHLERLIDADRQQEAGQRKICLASKGSLAMMLAQLCQ